MDGERIVVGLCVGRCRFDGVVGRVFGGGKGSLLGKRNLVMLFLEGV